MATVISKVYPTTDLSELLTDITNAYDWEEIENVDSNTVKLHIDKNKGKYIKVSKSSTYGITAYNGSNNVWGVTGMSASSTYKYALRVATCKSGLMLMAKIISDSSMAEHSPILIIGTATNPITKESEKVIFSENGTSSTFPCRIGASDNKTSSKTCTFPAVNLNSKLTTVMKLSSIDSEFVMDNALYIFNSELPALAHGSVTFGGKNYYMMSGFMLED